MMDKVRNLFARATVFDGLTRRELAGPRQNILSQAYSEARRFSQADRAACIC